MSNKKKADAAVHRAAANSPRRGSGGAHYRGARETAQCELEKLLGGAAKNEDNSGKSVSANVNVVVVGTPDGIFNTGSVFVFRRNGATWLDKPYRGDQP